MKRCLLCVLLSLVVLATGARQAVAAPRIVGYGINHGTSLCGFTQRVCTFVKDRAARYADITVAVKAPGATEWSPNECSWDNGDGTWTYTWRSCGHEQMPAVGHYELRATAPGGQIAYLKTGKTKTFPQSPLQFAPPLQDPNVQGVFQSTTPTISWLPYTFPSDAPDMKGGQLGSAQVMVFEWLSDEIGNVLVSRDCLHGDAAVGATSWTYNAGFWCTGPYQLASLPAGFDDTVTLTLSSVGHRMEDGGWYNESAQMWGWFTIAGPTP